MLIFNMATETKWFHQLLGHYPICFTDHRIKFIPADGLYADKSKNQPTHGNGFVYLGSQNEKFAEAFGRFGRVVPAFCEKG